MGRGPQFRATSAVDVVIAGGGVAGLSAFAALSPELRVCLIEREPILASHASGRNAAIFRPLESEDSTTSLSDRSLALLDKLADRPVLDPCGLVLASHSEGTIAGEARRAQQLGLVHAVWTGSTLVERLPELRGGQVSAGLHLPTAGVLDIHELTRSLERAGRRHGGEIRTGAAISRIHVEDGQVRGVTLADETHLPCRHVVLAAGAWAAALGAAIGAALPLRPVRRHLVHLMRPEGSEKGVSDSEYGRTILWRIDQTAQVYFRPEGLGLLASPCDETVVTGAVPTAEPLVDPTVLEQLAHRLAHTSPDFSRLNVRKIWACFRTFVIDRELVLGPDPRVDGLHWLCGLGGRGMGVGPAAGELVASALLGRPREDAAVFGVERLLSA